MVAPMFRRSWVLALALSACSTLHVTATSPAPLANARVTRVRVAPAAVPPEGWRLALSDDGLRGPTPAEIEATLADALGRRGFQVAPDADVVVEWSVGLRDRALTRHETDSVGASTDMNQRGEGPFSYRDLLVEIEVRDHQGTVLYRGAAVERLDEPPAVMARRMVNAALGRIVAAAPAPQDPYRY